MASRPSNGKSTRSWPLLLLIIPFITTLYEPLFNQTDPTLFGLPYFYGYLLIWIPVSAVITGVVYFLTK